MKRTEKSNLKTFKIILSGRVQGVGFRYFAEDRAFKHNVKGYVRNTRDNKVEVVCQGLKKNLDSFISEIKRGPALCRVTGFDIQELNDLIIYDSFEIKF